MIKSNSVAVHLVVSAGVPSLTPLGLRADLSPGTVFLLQLTFTCVRMRAMEDETEGLWIWPPRAQAPPWRRWLPLDCAWGRRGQCGNPFHRLQCYTCLRCNGHHSPHYWHSINHQTLPKFKESFSKALSIFDDLNRQWYEENIWNSQSYERNLKKPTCVW